MHRFIYIFIISIIFTFCSNTPTDKKEKKITIVANTIKYTPLSKEQKENYAQQITTHYNALLGNNFSGGIIVAKNNEILFEDYKGYYNYATKQPITPTSPLHIASVSKTFTAMTVLKLMEQGLINIDLPVAQYLQGFPYQEVTVKMLLNHRSGLFNYVHGMEDKVVKTITKKIKKGKKYITKTSSITIVDNRYKGVLISNKDILQFMIDKKPLLVYKPNTRFMYCNTNYALLALIIEKVTHTDYPTYMKKNVFEPLGLKNTYVFSSVDMGNYVPSYKGNYAPFVFEKLDAVYGDKNIYSTPQDLLLWDKALRENSFVSKASTSMAYTPYSFEKAGTHNYGLGWRLFVFPTDTIPYHNGWWHGNNAVFSRLIKDTATIIVLGNKYNTKIYKAKEMASIFTQNPNNIHSDSLQGSE